MRIHATRGRTGNALSRAVVAAICLALAGCGGGGSGDMASTPAPMPSPSPTGGAAGNTFDTAEFRRSDGPGIHNAVAAWQEGVTGAGVAIAVIDTGIDPNNPEFSGRISPASRDVAGNRGFDVEDDHGTHVALVAAAARDDSGIVGIAYEATIVALRTDSPGSCASYDPGDANSGCDFLDSDIAEAVYASIDAGARVINLSLGGTSPTSDLRRAIADAAAAGLVVVVSAGNNGDSTDPAIDPNNPDPFAAGLSDEAPGNLIIAGSIDGNGVFSDFSSRAGAKQDVFLSAQGESVCCLYENGQINTGFVINGTSFATPQIAGAAALLAQAFPNLTGDEIVRLLLENARDAGASGTDGVYGRGILDIGAALAPNGQTTMAGTVTEVSLGDASGTTSPAMGDAVADASLGAVILDGYDRAYAFDFARSLRTASRQPKLARALHDAARQEQVNVGRTAMAFTIAQPQPGERHAAMPLALSQDDAERSRVLAARITAALSPDTRVAFGFGQGVDGLRAALREADRPAFLIAGDAEADTGFAAMRDAALAVRHDLGGLGVTVSAERGRVWNDRLDSDAFRPVFSADVVTRVGAAFDLGGANFDLTVGASWMSEAGTVLGARFNPALVSGGADTLFVDGALAWRPASDWSLGLGVRQGYTWTGSDGASTGSRLVSRAWHADLERRNVLGDDALALRIWQPLRVESGGLSFDLPVSYDYATETTGFATRRLSLSPNGREIAIEAAWRSRLWGGRLQASLFHRSDPGHVAALPDDLGGALSWHRGF